MNLSSKQFAQPDLHEQIAQVLRDTGLEPSQLKMEITESVLIDHADTAAAVFAQLRAMRIQVAIDDFGTGYSSLSYLHRFPFDVLKIDQSFVGTLGTDGPHTAIVKAIVALAQALELEVIAEGIETAEQLDILLALGCTHGQGYLFSKPVDSEAAGALIGRTDLRST